MPLSRDLRTGPRNHYVDSLASDFTHIGDTLRRLSVEIVGRSALPADDITELDTEIARAHAAIDRISEALVFNRPALLTPGAPNDFMGTWLAEQRAAAEAAKASASQVAEARS